MTGLREATPAEIRAAAVHGKSTCWAQPPTSQDVAGDVQRDRAGDGTGNGHGDRDGEASSCPKMA